MPKFSKHHAKLACWSSWTQDGSPRTWDKKVIGGSLRKGETKQNKAVLVLFKCVQWLYIESIPLVKLKSLLELLHDLGLEDIAILKQTNISYDSYTTSDDILQCLSDEIDDELKEKLEKSPESN